MNFVITRCPKIVQKIYRMTDRSPNRVMIFRMSKIRAPADYASSCRVLRVPVSAVPRCPPSPCSLCRGCGMVGSALHARSRWGILRPLSVSTTPIRRQRFCPCSACVVYVRAVRAFCRRQHNAGVYESCGAVVRGVEVMKRRRVKRGVQ